MTRFLLLAPLALAARGTPCPVPRECITPEWCVCLVTGAVLAVSHNHTTREAEKEAQNG